MKRLLTALLFLAALVAPARAQYIGNVGLQTGQQTLFNNVACTGTNQTAVANNIGLSQHTLFLSTSVGTTFLQGFLEGSNDGVNFTRFSDEIDINNGLTGSISGSGYFQVVRANFTCLPAATVYTQVLIIL